MVLAVVVPGLELSLHSTASSAASSSDQGTAMADSNAQIGARSTSFVDLVLDCVQSLSPESCTWTASIWSAGDICLAIQALQDPSFLLETETLTAMKNLGCCCGNGASGDCHCWGSLWWACTLQCLRQGFGTGWYRTVWGNCICHSSMIACLHITPISSRSVCSQSVCSCTSHNNIDVSLVGWKVMAPVCRSSARGKVC